MSQEYSYQDVAEHNTKKDLFVVIHDKVYDCSKFVDEHPGGEEVMLDVAGQDATEAFEDVGHSDEARESLATLLVGDLKRQPGDPVPKAVSQNTPSVGGSTTGGGFGLYSVVAIGGLIAYFAYQYIQANAEQTAQTA
ncbi:cytochrome b5-like heme/Steroid binding domain-containing protein [Trichoderma breve]|uniref:Cytochrome b5-like heme/Steroid binding domain-containing protein n=1 Tax=Trichoderma breve TaxID=2034170 RepID=A0A9W9E789_9HYPO|nr:cytochrome b5-like heme/Steroid binding domain-containing protein [Trichoderma breve]KAJ4861633.1 cytochrome b5-like heme/Steroid binding domain-containing protein [Trichoderma breve]